MTHHQLQRELRELEAVGYDPHRISIYYPSDIQHAEVRLHAKYVRDCSGGTGMHDTTAGTQAAVMSRGF